MKHSVFDFLGQSPVAKTHARLELGEGCGVTIWENNNDRVRYEAPANNTFSLYLKGGTGTYRTDAGRASGYPGAVCVMPEGCDSEWEINKPFRFVHLYLSNERLRSGFVRTHDCDARRMQIDEVTFTENQRMAAPLLQLAHAAYQDDRLQAETAMAEFFGALDPKSRSISAGLSTHVLRRLDDWIDANLHEIISLEIMANQAGLSSFHFHRMFRVSRGLAPHAWVTEQRALRARQLLLTDQPIAQIAADCGFAHQSHLSRVFRRAYGVTPAQYRRLKRDLS
ncbi:MAG: helix-turn-helix transcriptional regulator [Cognatishimia sp.]|uniref:helix-turn-helix domain-containing protein n=1 Tax=Cognatishimia sp. TaxID=2211648 RepID=UPI003B8B0792